MNYKFKTKPYEHQITALKKSWDKEEYGYFMEMGTGKTKVLIDNMAMLYDRGKINGALIIAPKGVILESSAEVLKYAGQIYSHSAISNAMPPNNLTAMEVEERQILANWYEQLRKNGK